jgi:beta-galactosidase
VPEGKTVEICCFSNCDNVEISLNGKIIPGFPKHLQRGSSYPYRSWLVPFAKGEVVAIGSNNGVEVCRQVLRTPEEPVQLKISVDREILKADGEDLSFVRIDLLDKNGTFVPDGREKLHISVSGAGKLKGLCSGDPASHEKESASEMYTFNGSLLAIIQSSDTTGEITVNVSGENLAPATLRLKVC